MANYRSLAIWAEGVEFSKLVYENVNSLKDYGLRDQITRSAIPIPSNIAEGSERDSDPDFIRFLRIAKGSAAECRTQLLIAQLVGQLSKEAQAELDEKAEVLSKRISSLIKYLKKV